ncbi:MAG: hypothetical protein AB2L07_13620 [Thermoanaerobaculaceae bacterium]
MRTQVLASTVMALAVGGGILAPHGAHAQQQKCGFAGAGIGEIKPGVTTFFQLLSVLGSSVEVEVLADEDSTGPSRREVLEVVHDVRFAVPNPQPAVATIWLNPRSYVVERVSLDFRRFGPHSGESLVTVEDLQRCYGGETVRAHRGIGECFDPKGQLEYLVFPNLGIEASLDAGKPETVDSLFFTLKTEGAKWWTIPCSQAEAR